LILIRGIPISWLIVGMKRKGVDSPTPSNGRACTLRWATGRLLVLVVGSDDGLGIFLIFFLLTTLFLLLGGETVFDV